MKKTFATTLMLVILGLAICETALEGTRCKDPLTF